MSELPPNTSSTIEHDDDRTYEMLTSDVLKVGLEILENATSTFPKPMRPFGDDKNEYKGTTVGESGIESVSGPAEKAEHLIQLCVVVGVASQKDTIYLFLTGGEVKKHTPSQDIVQTSANEENLRKLEKKLLEAKDRLIEKGKMRVPGSGPVGNAGRSLLDKPLGSHDTQTLGAVIITEPSLGRSGGKRARKTP